MPKKLVIICGLSFSGKSTLARAICEKYGYVEVDVDLSKESLYGSDIQDQDLNPVQWETIYQVTDHQIEELLESGASVVDASRHFRFAERDQARNIASRVQAQTLVIYVDTPESVARQRWLQNREQPTRRDVTPDDFETIIRVMQPPTADETPLILHYDEEITGWLVRNAKYLELEQGSSV